MIAANMFIVLYARHEAKHLAFIVLFNFDDNPYYNFTKMKPKAQKC